MKNIYWIIGFVFFGAACFNLEDDGEDFFYDSRDYSTWDWNIPVEFISNTSTNREDVRAIDEPQFADYFAIEEDIHDTSLVTVVSMENDVRIYPHFILNHHEIVNDSINGTAVVVSYHPVSGFSKAYIRRVDDNTTSFGHSSLVYNGNLILFDRDSKGHFLQMNGKGVEGEVKGKQLVEVPCIQMDWAQAKFRFPNAKVLTKDTGYERDYTSSPYLDYEEIETPIFSIAAYDDTYFSKMRVLGADQDSKVIAYFFGEQERVENLTHNGEPMVRMTQDGFQMIYRSDVEGTTLIFEALSDHPEHFATDQEGNLWDVFGKAVEGPRTGQQLDHPDNAAVGRWFVWKAFYPDIEVVE